MKGKSVVFSIQNDYLFVNTRKIATEYKLRSHTFLPNEYWDELSVIKKEAVFKSEQLTAKVAWCFEIIGKIQDNYVKSFVSLCNDEFYEGWCSLEKCENLIASLDRHFREKNNEFGIEHIRIYTKNFQSLFPYEYFTSPGFISRHSCSVCNELITPRNYCGHDVGEIYNGEMCCKIVEDIELLELSIVKNPVQKYSVLFPEDHEYNYYVVKKLVKKLSSPWDSWSYNISKKIVPKYKKVKRNELCPCGSGIKYKRCCLNEKQEIDHYALNVKQTL